MLGERGQASIEWIGAAVLLALALAALGRVAGRVDVELVASALVDRTACAARGDCGRERDNTRGASRWHRSVTAPPPVPVPLGERVRTVPADGRRPPGALGNRSVGGLGRRSVGALWRRAWLLCFGYERARYGLLHPETGPRQTVPLAGTLQMLNDCASPVDFARDWEHLRPR